MSRIVVLATRNRAKVAELTQILGEPRVEVRPVDDFLPRDFEVEETGDTFEDNAWLKAEAICARTGFAALADDSGIEVDALGGRPGVRSARYAGEGASDQANNDLLLLELSAVPAEKRTARFVCALAFVVPAVGGGTLRRGLARETIEGRVVTTPRGEHGFGYDPLFEALEIPGKTTAEITPEQKNAISHRGKAARVLRPRLLEWLESVEADGSV